MFVVSLMFAYLITKQMYLLISKYDLTLYGVNDL